MISTLQKRIHLITKIALVVVVITIAFVLTSFFVPIPEPITESLVLATLCIAVYLIGLLHAKRIITKQSNNPRC